MTDKNYFEENGYKWGYEKTDETPYYYDLEYKGRIWCDYPLFKMLRSMDEKEYKQMDEESRCVLFNKNGLPVKCRLNCSTECPFGPNHSRAGSAVSIEAMQEGNSHIDFVDTESDPSKAYSYFEIQDAFEAAISSMDETDRAIYVSIRINGGTERNAAKALGISQPAVHKRLAKASAEIEEKLKTFID